MNEDEIKDLLDEVRTWLLEGGGRIREVKLRHLMQWGYYVDSIYKEVIEN